MITKKDERNEVGSKDEWMDGRNKGGIKIGLERQEG